MTFQGQVPISTLLLRHAVIGGQTARDDYVVIDAGHAVGRLRRATERAGEVWMWNVTVNVPGGGNGAAGCLEEAKAAFRQSWLAFKATIGEERLASALQAAQNARERSGKTGRAALNGLVQPLRRPDRATDRWTARHASGCRSPYHRAAQARGRLRAMADRDQTADRRPPRAAISPCMRESPCCGH
jgi:hypothetical protein